MIADLDLAHLCADTYTRDADIARGAAHACLTERADGIVVVSFRGSDSLADWLADLDDAEMIDDALGPCPRGFLMAVEGVAGELLTRVYRKSTVLTGHSLGGAEALLFGAMLVDAGFPPIQITTFGAPRCGRAMLARLLGSVSGVDWRHRDDPIPCLPPAYGNPRPVKQLGAPWLGIDVIEDHAIAAYVVELSKAS